jgi:hypothetical protein
MFLVPRLLKPEWFKQLYKTCDLVFDIPVGAECWPTNMYEPVVVGISFPFLSRPLWQLRFMPKMFYLEREMRKMWAISDMAAGDFLLKFLLEHKKLSAVPANVVRQMLHFKCSRIVPGKAEGTGQV